MIRFLGFEDLSPRYDAYNVSISFPYPEKKKDCTRGENVCVVYVSKNTFIEHFSGLEIGDQLDYSVGFNFVPYKGEPHTGEYKPYLKI